MQEIRLEIPGAVLRPLRLADAESVALHANDRRVSVHLRDRFPFPYAPSDAIAFIEMIAHEPRQLHFGIEVDGAVVGAVGLMPMDDVERIAAEIGYWLGVAHWGRGIMPEAVAAVTAYAHTTLGLHRVFAKVFDGNARSERVLQKAGYSLEGRLRAAVIKDGVVIDSLLYAHLAPFAVPAAGPASVLT